MPAELWTETLRLTGCGLVVAAAVAPPWWIARRKSRRAGEPRLPKPRPWRVPWTGFEVLLAFLILGPLLFPSLAVQVLSNAGLFTRVYGDDFPPEQRPEPDAPREVVERWAEASVVRGLWAGAASFPIQLAAVYLLGRMLYPRGNATANRPPLVSQAALAVPMWLILAVVVHAVHLVVNLTFLGLGWEPQQHSLTKLAGRPALDRTLFAFEACVRAPLMEEFFFRGLLLPWLLVRSYRVWPVFAATIFMALLGCLPATDPLALLTRGPLWFAIGLVAGWLLLHRFVPRKRRTLGAIYASAALFAAVHSGVWPTPIPLFVLGLGLGWLAVRVRGWLAAAAVHGLFNAISVLLVLWPA